MELSEKELSSSEKEVEITLSYEEVKTDIETEVKKQSKSIQLPGFRKGKVPLTILKKRFGDALEYEASEKVANSKFWKIANEKDLKPIGQPSITDFNFKPGEDLKFKVKYEVVPEIKAKDYTGQKIEAPDFKIGDEEVDKEIEYIVNSNRTLEDAEVVGDDKNFVLDVLLYRLKEDGEPENTNGEKIEIDLSKEGVNKDITENAKNKKVGDTFSFGFDDERTSKNDKGEEEKIKEHFKYKVEVKGIKKIVLPELNEELIKKVTKDKVSTPEELRSEIQKDIQGYYDNQNEEFIKNKLITTIIQNNEFTPPTTLVNNVLDQIIKNEVEHHKKHGHQNIDTNALRESYLKTAQNDVKWFLLKDDIIKQENISVPEEDLKALAEKDAEKTGISVDKLLNYYKNSGQNEKLLNSKLFDFLKEKNEIIKVDPKKFNKSEKKENK